MSEEGEIPPKEEENLNFCSDEDKEMYLWDELEYKVNIVHFISNRDTEQQMQVASAVINKLEEPVYDHRARIKERSRPLRKCCEVCLRYFYQKPACNSLYADGL